MQGLFSEKITLDIDFTDDSLAQYDVPVPYWDAELNWKGNYMVLLNFDNSV